ncbi:hypothetical protein [Streptomyces sp. x-19]|uniref:hypothetical protein n=1 Tax=Streptomyces sp. x-19 TaxID=2789280 RepID=UPI003980E8AF
MRIVPGRRNAEVIAMVAVLVVAGAELLLIVLATSRQRPVISGVLLGSAAAGALDVAETGLVEYGTGPRRADRGRRAGDGLLRRALGAALRRRRRWGRCWRGLRHRRA